MYAEEQFTSILLVGPLTYWQLHLWTWYAEQHSCFIIYRIFRSTLNTVLTHNGWLPRCVTEDIIYSITVHVEDCEHWWLFVSCGSTVEHWCHKPGVQSQFFNNWWLFTNSKKNIMHSCEVAMGSIIKTFIVYIYYMCHLCMTLLVYLYSLNNVELYKVALVTLLM